MSPTGNLVYGAGVTQRKCFYADQQAVGETRPAGYLLQPEFLADQVIISSEKTQVFIDDQFSPHDHVAEYFVKIPGLIQAHTIESVKIRDIPLVKFLQGCAEPERHVFRFKGYACPDIKRNFRSARLSIILDDKTQVIEDDGGGKVLVRVPEGTTDVSQECGSPVRGKTRHGNFDIPSDRKVP